MTRPPNTPWSENQPEPGQPGDPQGQPGQQPAASAVPVARSPDANVYVAFANSVKLGAPKGTEQELAFMRRQPEALAKLPKGDAPVIGPGDAFSPSFDSRRRQTFMTALAESFGQVFDAELLTLVPLTQTGRCTAS